MSKYKKKGIKLETSLPNRRKVSKAQSGAENEQILPIKKKVPGKPFVKGDPRIKPGRELGSTNFKTDFLRAIKSIKNADTKKAIEIHDLIRLSLETMIAAMQNGNHRYDKVYMDLLNRYYGTPTQNVDHTTGGEKLDIPQIIGMRIIKDNDDESKK